MNGSQPTRLGVVAISAGFGAFWTRLAEDLDLKIDVFNPEDALAPQNGMAAVILAAGGAEPRAAEWLETHNAPTGLPLLVVGTDPGRRTAMQMVTRGATDYFVLPADLEMFRSAVSSALSGGRVREAAASHGPADPFAGIVARSPAMRQALERAARLVPHRHARALIMGETGTGKELLARAIHAAGPRRAAPFVPVNCAAIPETLIESELFGHERGSFTDAYAAKPGLFEVADCGTLFLDEIGDLPLSLQAKLLRVLEEKEIRRVGGTKARAVDVRVLAATNDRLPERVREGSFREDLFFRLSSVVLILPPLRERGDDVVYIAEALLRQIAGEHELPAPTLTSEVKDRLRAHSWPGNVRELKNALERALLMAPAGQLCADELLPPSDRGNGLDGPIPFPAPLRDITTAVARAMVRLCDGNRREAARRLKISPRRLRRLLNGGDDASLGGDGHLADDDRPESSAFFAP